eukprot:gene13476-3937_t
MLRKQAVRLCASTSLTVDISRVTTKWRTSASDRNGLYFFQQTGEGEQQVSPWHDLPRDGVEDSFVFVNEIPKGTRAKMEINVAEAGNPIMQDLLKDGSLREFKYDDIYFNYGAMPRTWENPDLLDPVLNIGGDGDPLDLVELGSAPIQMGAIEEVVVLGSIGLVDQGEADWKILTLNRAEAAKRNIKSIDDLD